MTAGSVTTEALSVGTVTDNLVMNGTGQEGVANWAGFTNAQLTHGTDGWNIPGRTWFGFVKPGGDTNIGTGIWSRAFRLTPGRRYSMKLRVGGNTASATGLYIRVYENGNSNASPNEYSNIHYLHENGPVSSSTEGAPYEFTFTATRTWGSVVIINNPGGPADTYILDVEVRELVDGVRIADGAITAPKIVSKAITTDHLLVTGNGQVLNSDPFLEDRSAWEIINTGADFDINLGSPTGRLIHFHNPAGVNAAHCFSNRMPVDRYKNYNLRVWYAGNVGAGQAYLGVQFLDLNGNNIAAYENPAGWPGQGGYYYFGLIGNVAPNAWTEYQISFGPDEAAKIPPQARYMRFVCLPNFDANGSTQVLGGVRLMQKTDANLVVDGTILSRHIATGSVQTSHLAAESVQASKLAVGVKGINQVIDGSNESNSAASWRAILPYGGGGYIIPETYNGYTRSGHYTIVKADAGSGIQIVGRAMRVQPGRTYVFKASAWGSSDTPTGKYLRLHFSTNPPPSSWVESPDAVLDMVENGPWTAGYAEHVGAITVPQGMYWVSPVIINWINGPVLGAFTNVQFYEQADGVMIADGAVTAAKVAAGQVWAHHVAAGQIQTNHLQAGAVTASKIDVTDLSAIKSDLGHITAGYMQSPSGNTIFDLNNARIQFTGGGFMKVSGAGFGSAGQFIEWYGPIQSNLANCTEYNATYYLKVDGGAYFGGTLSAGANQNAAHTTENTLTASVGIGPYRSDGRQKVITCSYVYRVVGLNSNFSTGGNTATATVVIERSVNQGAWTHIGQLNATGSSSWTAASSSGTPLGQYSCNISGSISISDNTGQTNDMRVRARLISRSTPHSASIAATSVNEQTISIISTES